jgi:hypothetical protein
MKNNIQSIFVAIAVLFLLYSSIASTVWMIRNPIANEYQMIFNIGSVLTFSKENKFQTKEQ